MKVTREREIGQNGAPQRGAVSAPVVRHLVMAILTVLLAAGLLSCGTEPFDGLDGEWCQINDHCMAGLACDRQVCVSEDSLVPDREAYFFAGLSFDVWTGSLTGGQLEQFGRFVGQLTTDLFPYLGARADDETILLVGLVDQALSPVDLDTSITITQMPLTRQVDQSLNAQQATMMLPVHFSNGDVTMAFDMPLFNASITISNGPENGASANASMSGALRSVDAQSLLFTQDGETYSVFDILRNDPFEIDTNSDGILDAWAMRWSGTAVFL